MAGSDGVYAPWQRLNFLPLPHQQGSFRPTSLCSLTAVAVATQGTVVNDEHANVGRNDPCWCGSGKKFKRCHGA